jgi:hypothetical protein
MDLEARRVFYIAAAALMLNKTQPSFTSARCKRLFSLQFRFSFLHHTGSLFYHSGSFLRHPGEGRDSEFLGKLFTKAERLCNSGASWIPAFAGMTKRGSGLLYRVKMSDPIEKGLINA